MSFFKAMDISSSGLSAQRVRMNVLNSNLANAQATKGEPDGGPYRRRDVVFEAKPIGNAFEDLVAGSFGADVSKVQVLSIHKDQKDPRLVHDPSHPEANADGYVAMPNINVMTEMVNLIAAQRAFEANATALDDSKQMAMKALEIGR